MRARQVLYAVGVVLGGVGSVMLANADVKSAKRDDTKSSKAAKIDPKADQLLRTMSTTLAGMKSFTFDSHQVLEVVTKEGQKIQGLAETTVSIQRPNKLRVDRMGPLGGGSIYYDGTTFTFFGKRDNMYAQAPAPDTLDGMVDFAREKLSIDAPGADLLYSDAYKVLMEDVVSGQYLGEEMVGDRKCHHLAYRGNETDWQLWVEDDQRALPCRFVITSKKVTAQPQFTVMPDNFKETKLDDSSFVFKAPEGAKKIEFLTVTDKVEQKRQARRKQP